MKKESLFHRAETTVALMIGATAVSKALGMLRQMMTAGIFAASMEGIAFSAASGIPLAIFDMLFSTAVLGSFLPIYRGHLETDGKRARSFSSSFFTFIFLLTASASLLGVLLARPILRLAAPELDRETFSLATLLLRMMFPSMIFAGAAYILIGILQSREKFLLPACVSAVSNLMMIAYLSLCRGAVGRTAVIGLALVYVLSWLAQFLTLAVPLWHSGAFPRLTARLKTPDTALAVRRALPVTFGSWMVPMTTLIAKSFSSYVRIGSDGAEIPAGAAIVVYENAFSVFSIAAGLVTYGICNYLFPKLSAEYASGRGGEFSRLIRGGFLTAMAMILPVAGAMLLLSEEIVGFLYLRGSFTAALAGLTASALKILTLAMPFYGAAEFFSRVCYACGRVKNPAWASLTGIAASLIASLLFLRAGIASVEAAAVSSVLGQTAAGIVLWISGMPFLKTESNRQRRACGVLLFGCLLCVAVMRVCRDILRQIFHFSGTFQNFLIITIVFSVGFMVYSIWLTLMKPIRISHPRKNNGDENI